MKSSVRCVGDTFYIKYSDILDDKSLFDKLANNEIYCAMGYQKSIANYLNEEVRNFNGKEKYLTEDIGWVKGRDGLYKFIFNNEESTNIFTVNEIKIEQKGKLQDQLDFLKKEIFPYKETQLACILGLTSIISGLVEIDASIGTEVINISGQSSTGKSTVIELAGSFYSTPNSSNNGIVRTFNSTYNALISGMEGKFGLPIILDDINSNPNDFDRSSLVYQIASNQPKSRCISNGTLQQTRRNWSGLCLITSESPILDNEEVSQGAYARILTLDNIAWTQSAEHSERIKKGVRENYGYLGPVFAKYIESLDFQDIINKFYDAKEWVYNHFKVKDSYSKRIASKIAPIKVTADIFNLWLKNHTTNAQIDVESIMEIIFENEEMNCITRNTYENTMEALKQMIAMNRAHFDKYLNNNVIDHKGDFYGFIIWNKESKYIALLDSVFKKFLKDRNITERRSLLKKWKEDKKIICSENDRYCNKVGKNTKERCLCIPLDEEGLTLVLPDYSRTLFPSGGEVQRFDKEYQDYKSIDEIFKEE